MERAERQKRQNLTTWQQICRNTDQVYFWYEVLSGAYLYVWWEKLILLLIFVGLILLLTATAHRQLMNLVGFASSQWDQHQDHVHSVYDNEDNFACKTEQDRLALLSYKQKGWLLRVEDISKFETIFDNGTPSEWALCSAFTLQALK